jgi:alkanesulfonate monooxygenase SsuD/methylene tetrahydromethanopterin reductase-like flavin-dependent oxidoreductase (luciferase family)
MELGTIGIWSSALRAAPPDQATEAVRRIEAFGFGTAWLPSGPPGQLERVRELVEATSTLTVATGILNVYTESDPRVTAAKFHDIDVAHPERVLLGIGVGHPQNLPPGAYGPPLATIGRYLDAHTRRARTLLGEGPLLAPEQGVVLEADPVSARGVARLHLQRYLRLTNYVNNFRELGFVDADFEQGGSDHLVDEIVAWGSVGGVAERVRKHLDAGASHVAIQVLTERPHELPVDEWSRLAAELLR